MLGGEGLQTFQKRLEAFFVSWVGTLFDDGPFFYTAVGETTRKSTSTCKTGGRRKCLDTVNRVYYVEKVQNMSPIPMLARRSVEVMLTATLELKYHKLDYCLEWLIFPQGSRNTRSGNKKLFTLRRPYTGYKKA